MDKKRKRFLIFNRILILLILILLILILILYFAFRRNIISSINKDAIEKYIAYNFPEYEIEEKSYRYLDTFWSTWDYIEKDDSAQSISCLTTLKNKKTGMYISIPFYHSSYGVYKTRENNIKQYVKDYEKFWNDVNNFSKEKDVEIHLSNAVLNPNNAGSITALMIYIKEEKNIDIQEIIDSINKIDNNLIIRKDYLVSKENQFEKFRPWKESNKFYVTTEDRKPVNSELYYDYYIFEKYYEDWIKSYYVFY